jgi:hypothetical protein
MSDLVAASRLKARAVNKPRGGVSDLDAYGLDSDLGGAPLGVDERNLPRERGWLWPRRA